MLVSANSELSIPQRELMSRGKTNKCEGSTGTLLNSLSIFNDSNRRSRRGGCDVETADFVLAIHDAFQHAVLKVVENGVETYFTMA